MAEGAEPEGSATSGMKEREAATVLSSPSPLAGLSASWRVPERLAGRCFWRGPTPERPPAACPVSAVPAQSQVSFPVQMQCSACSAAPRIGCVASGWVWWVSGLAGGLQ